MYFKRDRWVALTTGPARLNALMIPVFEINCQYGLPSMVRQVEFASVEGRDDMYGLIGKMIAAPGKREALASVLMDGISGMPGCLSYIVAYDGNDQDALWITEVWETKQAHEASLGLPSVRDAIAHGRPMIVGFGERIETTPIGGHGISEG